MQLRADMGGGGGAPVLRAAVLEGGLSTQPPPTPALPNDVPLVDVAEPADATELPLGVGAPPAPPLPPPPAPLLSDGW